MTPKLERYSPSKCTSKGFKLGQTLIMLGESVSLFYAQRISFCPLFALQWINTRVDTII